MAEVKKIDRDKFYKDLGINEQASTNTATKLEPKLEPEATPANYGIIKQGVETNKLSKVVINTKNTKSDPKTGIATYKYDDDFSIFIADFNDLKGFRTSTSQLLDALTMAYTQSGTNNPIVSLSITDYMELRDLKDRKSARKQINEDLDTLYMASINYRRINVKDNEPEENKKDYMEARVIQKRGIVKGNIIVTFADDYKALLDSYTIMAYPEELYKINGHYNPYSFYLLRRILEHKNMNVGKKNENRISVDTLLKACPNMPTYIEVMNTDRAVNRRIIEPFERDLDAEEVSEVIRWNYCHKNGKPLTDKELTSMDYNLFQSLLIEFEFKNYPSQVKRLNKKYSKKSRR